MNLIGLTVFEARETTRTSVKNQPFKRKRPDLVCPMGVWRGGASNDVGSVIVNDGNSRFFEPGLGRKLWVGLEAQRRF